MKTSAACIGKNFKRKIPSLFWAIIFLPLFFFLLPQSLQAQEKKQVEIKDKGPEEPIILQAGEIEWKDGPASFEQGSQYAIIEGDPGEAGLFNMRLKLPDGFIISPHTHPNVERVTILSGTFKLGHGTNVTEDATTTLTAGGYFSMPPGMVHFAIAEGETIVQLKSIGPWQINYVNPEDDPRNRRVSGNRK